MRDPRRDLPVSILGGVAIAGALYALLLLACFATVKNLAGSTRPIADAAEALTGPLGGTIIVAAAVFSCAGGLAGAMLVAPRILYALGRSGDLPRVLATVHPTHGTPQAAIIVMAYGSWLLAVTGTFVYITTVFVIARILTYGSTCAALLVLRKRDGSAPVPIPGGPVIAVLALACCAGQISHYFSLPGTDFAKDETTAIKTTGRSIIPLFLRTTVCFSGYSGLTRMQFETGL